MNDFAKDRIQVHDLYFKPMIHAQDIDKAIKTMALQLQQEFADASELLVMVVLKGAFIFAADLLRQLSIPCRVEMIKASSYGAGIVSSGTVELQMPHENWQGRHILLLEDIIDSGLTVDAIRSAIIPHKPAKLKIAAILSKPSQHKTDMSDAIVGFEITPNFVIGYGLDYNQLGRNLPHIYQLDQ